MDNFSTPKIIIVQSNHKQRNIFIAVIILFLILTTLVFLLFKTGLVDITGIPNSKENGAEIPLAILSTPKPSAEPANKVFQFYKCNSLQKKRNPIIGNEPTTVEQGKDSFIAGSLIGNINSISFDKATQKAKIEFISADGLQTYTTEIKEEPKLVYNSVTKKDSSLSELKTGNSVVISFNCFKDKNLFKIVTIEVNGNVY